MCCSGLPGLCVPREDVGKGVSVADPNHFVNVHSYDMHIAASDAFGRQILTCGDSRGSLQCLQHLETEPLQFDAF